MRRRRFRRLANDSPQAGQRWLRCVTAGIVSLVLGPDASRATCGDFGRPDGTEIVEFETNVGSICLELLRDDAPETVANFLVYVERGDYDGTILHRSVAGFVLQGGGYAPASGMLDRIPEDDRLVLNEPCDATEFVRVDPFAGVVFACVERGNDPGTMAMAKVAGDPDSATNQWFLNLADNSDPLDNNVNGGFTVFARVLGDTFAVVEAIADLPPADQSAGFFLGPEFGEAFDVVPLLAETPAMVGSFGCWDPGNLSLIGDDPFPAPGNIGLVPDPEFGGYFLLADACGTEIPRGDFEADPGPESCPDLDILGTALADPILDFIPKTSTATGEFLQFEFSCEQAQEALTQRALWQADLWQRMLPQLVVLEHATVRVVPEPAGTGAGLVALGSLAIVHHTRRMRRQ
jgi:cyclophilin family peptidyl-prolyl cis-trans isomerase